jgi:hypothetical protein
MWNKKNIFVKLFWWNELLAVCCENCRKYICFCESFRETICVPESFCKIYVGKKQMQLDNMCCCTNIWINFAKVFAKTERVKVIFAQTFAKIDFLDDFTNFVNMDEISHFYRKWKRAFLFQPSKPYSTWAIDFGYRVGLALERICSGAGATVFWQPILFGWFSVFFKPS